MLSDEEIRRAVRDSMQQLANEDLMHHMQDEEARSNYTRAEAIAVQAQVNARAYREPPPDGVHGNVHPGKALVVEDFREAEAELCTRRSNHSL